MDYIKNIFAKQVEKAKQAKESVIQSTFNIAHKDDKLWITHDGYGIKEIDDDTTAKEIVALINNFKDTAVRFK